MPPGAKRWLKSLPGATRLAGAAYSRAGERLTPLPDHGFSLYLDMRSPTHRSYASASSESHVVRHLLEVLRPGDVVIDVGAYVGFFTILCARAVRPGGSVIAFDPVPDNCERIARSAAANGLDNATTEARALGDRIGSARLGVSRETGGAASSTSSLEAPGTEVLTVPVETLDAYVERAGLARLDLVKIDVEGLEREVVAGMRAVLDRFRPRLVIEFRDDDAATGCLELLRSSGYTTVELGRTRHGLHIAAKRDG
jgi:FkbM family methyltransferase